MKIGLVQMNSQGDKAENLMVAEKMIRGLGTQGAELVMLPEHFNFIGSDEEKPDNAEALSASPSLDRMRNMATELGIYLHIGSFLESAGSNIYNSGVVFDPSGEIVAHYRKIHLFDVEVPGGKRYAESDTITPGKAVVTLEIGDLTFGMATCYDLRFPELFRKLVELGTDVILLPAAFTLMTGKDHWELLLRARAVENLCWVAAAGQYGQAPPNHESFGRSMVINPWGIVTAQAADGVSTVLSDIDPAAIHETRVNFPALTHRRRDLF